MKTKIYILSFISVFLLINTSCRREVTKLRSSVRKVETEVKFYEKTAGLIGAASGVSTLTLTDQFKSDSISVTEPLAPIRQKSMLNSYGFIYDLLNDNDSVVGNRNFYFDSINETYRFTELDYKRINENYEVFGWHPHWMRDAWKTYPFELLSTLSFFSYDLDANTGSYKNENEIAEWRRTAMIDSAKAKDVRVLLTVSSHGYKNNELFLDHPEKWTVTIDSLLHLLEQRGADGIDLNFEQLPYLRRGSFNRFVKEVDFQFSKSEYFSKRQKPPFISLTLPAVDSREIFDVKSLDKFIDLFVIMGYDYHTGIQSQGAVAPLRSIEKTGISLSNTVDFYLNQGINRSKTILGLPYYGTMWDGSYLEDGTFQMKLERKITYAEVRKIFDDEVLRMDNITPILEQKSMTNYLNLVYPDKTSKEIWYDDDYTLSRKYDYALSNGLRGVGIWALGYDSGFTELWDVIEDRFAIAEKVVEDPIAEIEGYPLKVAKFFNNSKPFFLVAIFFFSLAVLCGFLILLSDWKVREVFVSSGFNKWIFLFLSMFLLTPLMFWLNSLFLIKSSWQNYVAFLLGGILVVVFHKIRFNGIKRP
jgi:spore germination protein YaaH